MSATIGPFRNSGNQQFGTPPLRVLRDTISGVSQSVNTLYLDLRKTPGLDLTVIEHSLFGAADGYFCLLVLIVTFYAQFVSWRETNLPLNIVDVIFTAQSVSF